MSTPLVSICIPTYNGSQFIWEAINSALEQTYPNIEIILSDDQSEDQTIQILESLKKNTKVPIHIHHHEPSGIGANWNHCIKNSNGTFIKFLFQDDVLLPNCIERMVDILLDNGDVALVASKRDFIIEPSFMNDETKRWIEIYGDLQGNLDLVEEDGIACIDNNIFSTAEFFKSPLNKIGEPTSYLFRKDLVLDIGYYREDLNQVLDYEFCYRILKSNKIAILNDKLVKFRLHESQSTVLNKEKNIFKNEQKFMDRIFYKEYYDYLSPKRKKELLRKHNRLVRALYNLMDLLKRAIRKT